MVILSPVQCMSILIFVISVQKGSVGRSTSGQTNQPME